MVTGVVAFVVVGLVLAFVVLYARDSGPPPSDVATAYEAAWDHLDFASLWALSGDELRDGLGRKEFVSAKRTAYAGQDVGDLVDEIHLDDVGTLGSTSTALSRLELRDGSVIRNEIRLAKRAGRWVVVGYRLRTDAPPAPA
jgi:hypothetical protein